MKRCIGIIQKHKDKITIPDDVLVYRGVAASEPIKKMSKGKIISTSLKSTQAETFLDRSDKKYRSMNCILLRKGTPYIMPLTALGEQQQEIMIIESDIKLNAIGTPQFNKDMELTSRPCLVQCFEAEAAKIEELEKITGQDLGKLVRNETKDVSTRHKVFKDLNGQVLNIGKEKNLDD